MSPSSISNPLSILTVEGLNESSTGSSNGSPPAANINLTVYMNGELVPTTTSPNSGKKSFGSNSTHSSQDYSELTLPPWSPQGASPESSPGNSSSSFNNSNQQNAGGTFVVPGPAQPNRNAIPLLPADQQVYQNEYTLRSPIAESPPPESFDSSSQMYDSSGSSNMGRTSTIANSSVPQTTPASGNNNFTYNVNQVSRGLQPSSLQSSIPDSVNRDLMLNANQLPGMSHCCRNVNLIFYPCHPCNNNNNQLYNTSLGDGNNGFLASTPVSQVPSSLGFQNNNLAQSIRPPPVPPSPALQNNNLTYNVRTPSRPDLGNNNLTYNVRRTASRPALGNNNLTRRFRSPPSPPSSPGSGSSTLSRSIQSPPSPGSSTLIPTSPNSLDGTFSNTLRNTTVVPAPAVPAAPFVRNPYYLFDLVTPCLLTSFGEIDEIEKTQVLENLGAFHRLRRNEYSLLDFTLPGNKSI